MGVTGRKLARRKEVPHYPLQCQNTEWKGSQHRWAAQQALPPIPAIQMSRQLDGQRHGCYRMYCAIIMMAGGKDTGKL